MCKKKRLKKTVLSFDPIFKKKNPVPRIFGHTDLEIQWTSGDTLRLLKSPHKWSNCANRIIIIVNSLHSVLNELSGTRITI